MRNIAAAFVFLLLAPVPVHAATVNLSVDPLVTEMHVAAGQTGRTSVTIANNGDVDETVTLKPIDWTTQLNGAIALFAPGAQSSHSLTAWLEPATYRFTLLAHQRRQLEVALAIPANALQPRSYWGGLLIRGVGVGQNLAIAPAATLFVYDDVGSPKRHLSIKAFHAAANSGGSVAVTIRLKNDGEAYARTGGTLTISRSGAVVEKCDLSIGAIFPGHTRIVEQAITGLSAGTYVAGVTIDYGGDVILAGETRFVVP